MTRTRITIYALIAIVLFLGLACLWKLKKDQERRVHLRLKAPPPVTLPLEIQCERRLEQLKARLHLRFNYVFAPPFVIAGDISMERMKRYTERTIMSPARLMWRNYFAAKPDRVITILLFAGQKSYRSWTRRLFGIQKIPYFGYYTNYNRTLNMDINTGWGTLVHELTHALIVYDYPKVPDWFNEGLASLHEGVRIDREQLTGLVNWRLPILHKAIREKRLRPLQALITADDFYGPHIDENYAQARYFMMYAQTKGVIRELYRHLRDSNGPEEHVSVVERIFGVTITALDTRFVTWALRRQLPR